MGRRRSLQEAERAPGLVPAFRGAWRGAQAPCRTWLGGSKVDKGRERVSGVPFLGHAQAAFRGRDGPGSLSPSNTSTGSTPWERIMRICGGRRNASEDYEHKLRH